MQDMAPGTAESATSSTVISGPPDFKRTISPAAKVILIAPFREAGSSRPEPVFSLELVTREAPRAIDDAGSAQTLGS